MAAGQFLVALVLADLSTRIPLSGYGYQWSTRLVNPHYGYFVGWLLLMQFLTGFPGVCHALATTLCSWTLERATAAMWVPWVAVGIVTVTAIVHLFGIRLVSLVNDFGVMAEVVAALALTAILLAIYFLQGKHDATFLFDRTSQLPTVWMPTRRVRQWRSLIHYRHELVSRRTAILCSIRSLLDKQGRQMASQAKAWTEAGIERLRGLARPAVDCGPDELWRGQLAAELTLLAQLQTQIRLIEGRLDALAEADARTTRLRTIPGVGPRLSEAVVAWIDDPHRFSDARAVGAYVGLVPRRRQSGTYDRSGRVTKHGPSLLRKLLVEVAWIMRQHNPHAAALIHEAQQG